MFPPSILEFVVWCLKIEWQKKIKWQEIYNFTTLCIFFFINRGHINIYRGLTKDDLYIICFKLDSFSVINMISWSLRTHKTLLSLYLIQIWCKISTRAKTALTGRRQWDSLGTNKLQCLAVYSVVVFEHKKNYGCI